MADTRIVEKIRKLLKLAADPSNPNEAALAAERAQELLFSHHLDIADVAEDTFGDVTEVNRPYIFEPWRKALAAILCTYNFCRLLEWTGGMKFIGGKIDVEMVLYLYVYLSRSIHRLARESWEKRVADFTDPVLGRYPALDEPGAEEAWKDSFRIGVVEMIGVRLKRQRDAQDAVARFNARRSQEPGLVRATTALQAWDGRLASYVHEKYGPVTQAEESEVNVNLGAFTEGVRTGQRLPLSRGIGGGTKPKGIDG